MAELAAGTPDKFVLADSRERIGLFRGVCVKPNEREAAGFDADFDKREARGKSVFVTLGEKGIRLLRPGTEPIHVPAYPVTGPVDICGAGDSCSACGLSDVQAAMLGNLIASVTVQQIGVTGTCTPAQLLARWAEVKGD
jgi:bifunctional ADP-heptose synthase (sugar kinase/adenylyltransferase)